jgi:hypothetical protein
MQFLEAEKLTYVAWYTYKYYLMAMGNYTWAKRANIVLTLLSARMQPIQEYLPRIFKTSWIRHYDKHTDHITMQCTQQPVHWLADNTMSKLAEYRNIRKILSFWMWSRVDTNKFTDVSEVPTASIFYSQQQVTSKSSFYSTLRHNREDSTGHYPRHENLRPYLRSACKLHKCGNHSFNKRELTVFENVQFKRNSISMRPFQGHVGNKVD